MQDNTSQNQNNNTNNNKLRKNTTNNNPNNKRIRIKKNKLIAKSPENSQAIDSVGNASD